MYMNEDRSKTLVYASIVAGPLYIVLFALQILIRSDLDLTSLTNSALTSGEFGWIQQLSLIISGGLLVIGFIGISYLVADNRVAQLGAVLIGAFGLLIVFNTLLPFLKTSLTEGSPQADFIDSLDFVLSNLGLTGNIVGLFLFSRYFSIQRNWALFTIITGLVYFLPYLPLILGLHQGLEALIASAFLFALIFWWGWAALVSLKIRTS